MKKKLNDGKRITHNLPRFIDQQHATALVDNLSNTAGEHFSTRKQPFTMVITYPAIFYSVSNET